MTNSPGQLQLDEFNRPIVYISSWQWYGGRAWGMCLYDNYEEALRDAVFNARDADWDNFPDPAKEYPNDDRTGNEQPQLYPRFRVTWGEGDSYGESTVTTTAIVSAFTCGDAKYNVDNYLLRNTHETTKR